MPEWIPAEAKGIWDTVLKDLVKAGVPLMRVDNHAVGMYCATIHEAQKAAGKGDTKLAARLGRDVLQWAAAIGATPASRARLGIKPPANGPDADDPWARLK